MTGNSLPDICRAVAAVAHTASPLSRAMAAIRLPLRQCRSVITSQLDHCFCHLQCHSHSVSTCEPVTCTGARSPCMHDCRADWGSGESARLVGQSCVGRPSPVSMMLKCPQMSSHSHCTSVWGRPGLSTRVCSHMHASTSHSTSEQRGRHTQPCAAKRMHEARPHQASASASADSPAVASTYSEQAERSRDWEHKAVFQGTRRASRRVREGDRPLGEVQRGC